jgi:hypothetical protein
LSLHKLTANQRKHLMQVALLQRSNWRRELLMDVNKPEEVRDALL